LPLLVLVLLLPQVSGLLLLVSVQLPLRLPPRVSMQLQLVRHQSHRPSRPAHATRDIAVGERRQH
jgi:hypothetical protein